MTLSFLRLRSSRFLLPLLLAPVLSACGGNSATPAADRPADRAVVHRGLSPDGYGFVDHNPVVGPPEDLMKPVSSSAASSAGSPSSTSPGTVPSTVSPNPSGPGL